MGNKASKVSEVILIYSIFIRPQENTVSDVGYHLSKKNDQFEEVQEIQQKRYESKTWPTKENWSSLYIYEAKTVENCDKSSNI